MYNQVVGPGHPCVFPPFLLPRPFFLIRGDGGGSPLPHFAARRRKKTKIPLSLHGGSKRQF